MNKKYFLMIGVIIGILLLPFILSSETIILDGFEYRLDAEAQDVFGNHNDIVPEMTASNVPSPYVISASSTLSAYYPWEAFDNAGGYLLGWISAIGTTGWLKIDLGANNKQVVRKYVLTPDTVAAYTYTPKDWKFQGSNDDINWDILDTQTSATPTLYEKKAFLLSNNKAYRYYMINVSAVNGGAYVDIVEMELFTDDLGYKDLCYGGTAYSESEYSASYDDEFAFDGGGSIWSTTQKGSAVETWLAYNFSSPKIITGVKTYATNANLNFKNFTIQGSIDSTNGTDGSWTYLATGLYTSDTNSEWTTFDFTNSVAYSWIKLVGDTQLHTGSLYYLQVAEIEMYETIPAQCYSESIIKNQGNYSMKVITTTDALNNTFVKLIQGNLGFEGVDTINFDVRANRTGTNFLLGLRDTGDVLNTHSVNITSANVWQTETWDLSSIADADKDNIDQLILKITNSDADNTIYIDNFVYLPSAVQTSADFVLDKIVTIHNITNNTINYNITLRVVNKGGSDATTVNLTDSDSSDSPYDLTTVGANSSVVRSYIKNFTRQDTTTYQILSIAQAQGIDSYLGSLISANSTEINLTIPNTEIGKQIAITKNVVYLSSNSTTVTYNVSSTLYNSGDEDLTSINYIDTDLNNTAFTIDINKGDSYLISKSNILDKAASNTNNQFALGTATVGGLNFYSNRPTIRIPGYGGPADAIVYAPSSVLLSTSFDTIVYVENMNPDIGQDFTIEYWITNVAEDTNYTSGEQTIYVASSGNSNLTSTLTSPSSAGTYRYRSIVTWAGGTATAYDTFTVTAPVVDSGTGSSSGGGGITGKTIYESDDKDIKKGKTQKLKDGEKVKFNVIQEGFVYSHSLEIVDLQLDRATITIYSNPITIFLYIGEDKKLDLNEDGFYDLYVKLEKIEKNKADIYLKSIYEVVEVEEPGLSPEDEEDEEEKETVGKEFFDIKINKFSLIVWILILGIIGVSIFIIVSIFRIRKNKEKSLKKVINFKEGKYNLLLIFFGFILLSFFTVATKAGITGGVIGLGNTNFGNLNLEIILKVLIISVLSAIIIYLIYFFKKIKMYLKSKSLIKKKDNIKISLVKNIQVYAGNGKSIGKVKEVYLKGNKIDSWLIKVKKNIAKKIKKKNILVKHKHVLGIGDVMIIKEKVSEHLEKLDSNIKNIISTKRFL